MQHILWATLFVPVAALLFVPGVFSWPLGLLYLALLITRLGPHAVVVHLLSHGKLFKRPWQRLNHFVPWFLVLLYGITPGGYKSHHLGMHHAEENIAPDTSSTLYYQRDSIWAFLRYMFRFTFFGKIELAIYLHRKNKKRALWQLIKGDALQKTVMIVLLFVNWQAALVTVVIPYVVLRYGLMMGNWTEHAFVDRADPGNAYRNSVTLVNCPYNHSMYNDGYHCAHHIRSSTHWADLPGFFEKDYQKYVDNDAVVFDGIRGFQVLWLHLMFRRYELMAKHLVPIGSIPEDLEARTAWLRARTTAETAA